MIYPDPDGVTCRVPLAIDMSGVRYPAIGLAAFAIDQGIAPQVVVRGNQVLLGDKRLPVDESGQMLLNYVNRDAIKESLTPTSRQGKADYSLLRDKIVLVGATVAVHESYTVPATISNSPVFERRDSGESDRDIAQRKFLARARSDALIAEALIIAVIAGVTLPQLPWLVRRRARHA